MKQYAIPTYRGGLTFPTLEILRFRIPAPGTIERISFYNSSATSDDLVLDVRLNNVSLFPDPADRPTIGDGAYYVVVDGLDVDVVRGDIITIDFLHGELAQLDVLVDIEDGVSAGVGPAGPQGEPGPDGAPGADGADGQGFTWLGAWSGLTDYVPYDVVSYGGSSWVAVAGNTNIVPAEGATWNKVASKGDDGADGEGGGAETDFITGLELSKTGNQEVTISPGAAYVPDAGEIVRLTAAVAVSPTHAAGKWYFYLYDNAGSGAIEASQTAPTFYNNDAQHKTGDDSRRFIGFALSDGVAWHDFKADANDKRATIIWEAAGYSAGWSLVVGGTASTNGGEPLSIANHVPPGGAILHLLARLFSNANSQIFYGINGRAIPSDSSDAGYWGSEVLLEHWNPTGTAGVEKILPVDVHVGRGATNIYYRYTAMSGSGAISLYVRGLTYRR